MTTLREAAQQALEAVEQTRRLMPDSYYHERLHKAAATLRAALAEPNTCTWCQDGDTSVYQTSCRQYFDLTDGTPEDNKMQWCCYCGKKLVQELITEDDDE